jgi:hypothetical protein
MVSVLLQSLGVAYLISHVTYVHVTGSINPTYIRYLTKTKAYNQIFRRLLFGERKDRFVPE